MIEQWSQPKKKHMVTMSIMIKARFIHSCNNKIITNLIFVFKGRAESTIKYKKMAHHQAHRWYIEEKTLKIIANSKWKNSMVANKQ